MEPPTFADLIKRCNAFLFGHMYPGGTLVFRSDQHRDLVRTFFAGAMEALMATSAYDAVASLIDEYCLMAAEQWRPDERFRIESSN